VGCKYSLSRAKQVIESYFIVRAELPKFFGSFTEEELEDATAYGQVPIAATDCTKLFVCA